MNSNDIGIHFIGLDAKEIALFERVISFSVTHGLKANVLDNVDDADLIITTEESFGSVEEKQNDKTLVVIINEDSSTKGDFQISRPLMITKVMNLLTSALEKAKEKKSAGPSDNSSIEADSTSTTEVEEEKAPSLHALIIDDSAAIRKQLELELRDAGLTSDFAVCGEDAIEQIKENHYDLIFLDIIMPGLDGYDTCKAMRSNPKFKKTPIIMLSGKTAPLDEVKGVIAGATTYLTKPVKSDKLQVTLNRVTKWINNYAPPKQTESA